MAVAAPPSCANTYFVMPPLTGLIATAGADNVTATGTDSWTS